jgi:hypothetical protein
MIHGEVRLSHSSGLQSRPQLGMSVERGFYVKFTRVVIINVRIVLVRGLLLELT